MQRLQSKKKGKNKVWAKVRNCLAGEMECTRGGGGGRGRDAHLHFLRAFVIMGRNLEWIQFGFSTF